MRLRLSLLGLLMIAAFVASASGAAAKSEGLTLQTPVAITDGAKYDRNPATVVDGKTTWLFFARSQADCNRLNGCPNDNSPYDLYVASADDKGATGPTLLAANPGPPGFYGRTISATRLANGTLVVFWASGGSAGPLYYLTKPAGGAWSSLQSLNDQPYFNVNVVSKGSTAFVYYEDGTGAGVFVRTFDGTSFSAPSLVAANMSIPKAMIDKHGVFRIAMVSGTTYPVVSVYVASSSDGVHWSAPSVVVQGVPPVTNWDPTLAQVGDKYELFFAPDQGDGRQILAVSQSKDFASWSAPQALTTGVDGTTPIWDYWPAVTKYDGKTYLLWTSERSTGTQAAGTGHIWAAEVK